MTILTRVLAGGWAGAILALVWLIARRFYLTEIPTDEDEGFVIWVMAGGFGVGAVLGLLSGARRA